VRGSKPCARAKDQQNVEALEWRYYLILHGRYVEGESIAELQKRLALGERQERRLHGRALSALENTLWDRFFAAGDAAAGGCRAFWPAYQ
jgi:hypothetical protein